MNFKPTRTKIIDVFILSLILTIPFVLLFGFISCLNVGCIQGIRMDNPCEYSSIFPLSCCGGGWSRKCVSLFTYIVQIIVISLSSFLITFFLLYFIYSLFEKKR